MRNQTRSESVDARVKKSLLAVRRLSLSSATRLWRTRRTALVGWLALSLGVPILWAFSEPVPHTKQPAATVVQTISADTRGKALNRRHDVPVTHATSTKNTKTTKPTKPKHKIKAPVNSTPPVVSTTTTTFALPVGSGGSSSTTTTVTPPSAPTAPPTPSAPPVTTTTTTTTTLAPQPPSGNGSWWHPPLGNLPWQWEIDHALNVNSATDMGTNDTLPNGQSAPAPKVYDIDGIINPASTVSALHALGDHAICYIEVGTAGNYYSASDEGIPTTYYAQYQAAGVFGNKLSGYPEYFLNINSPATVAITEAMISQQCAAKGFDAVETDLDETYAGSDGATGFSLTQANEVAYMTTLANYMHGLGLAWIIKNPDDTGDNYAALMEPIADGVLTEQCNQYSTCSDLSAYFGQKAIFNAEYQTATTAFCPADIALGINGAKFPVDLSGARSPCS
jgi:hypothetical protein